MPTSKPTNIDAQRILAIMDELKEKLTYLSVISQEVLEGVQGEEGQSTCELLGTELMKQFAEQIRLEELYVVANTASDGTFTQQEETEGGDEEGKNLQTNTLKLCRMMRSIPNITKELSNFQNTRPSAMIQFLQTLAAMQDLTLKRLTTTVEEQRSRDGLLDHYKKQEEEASRRRQQLEKDLHHIRREREKKQTFYTEQLTKLKADLQDNITSTEQKMDDLRKHYDERRRKLQEDFNADKEKLTKQIEALTAQNVAMRNASEEDELQLRRRKGQKEREVDAVIKAYDKDIKEMTWNINEQVEGEMKEQKQLQELREHFQKVDLEKHTIEAEEMLTQARRAKMEADKEKKNEMARLVQSYFRGIIQREQFLDMKRKAKKGAKGKKKGK